jgi:hypothetical protein
MSQPPAFAGGSHFLGWGRVESREKSFLLFHFAYPHSVSDFRPSLCRLSPTNCATVLRRIFLSWALRKFASPRAMRTYVDALRRKSICTSGGRVALINIWVNWASVFNGTSCARSDRDAADFQVFKERTRARDAGRGARKILSALVSRHSSFPALIPRGREDFKTRFWPPPPQSSVLRLA